MLTHVDLFSGIGGFALAASWAGVETIAFAEIDPYASRVLKRHWPNVHNYGDVRNVPTMDAWLVTGGVPCQPASSAGRRRGATDDRWQWPAALAVAERGDYEWILLENPTGILSLSDGLEFEDICAALERQDYTVQPIVVPAAAVDAKHRRDRVWILAHTKRCRGRKQLRANTASDPLPQTVWQEGAPRLGSGGEDAPNAAGGRLERRGFNDGGHKGTSASGIGKSAGSDSGVKATTCNSAIKGLPDWAGGEVGQPCPLTEFERPSGREIERDFRGVAHGVSRRVDRLKGLGNSVVPQVAYQLIKRMIEAEAQNELTLKITTEEKHGALSFLT